VVTASAWRDGLYMHVTVTAPDRNKLGGYRFFSLAIVALLNLVHYQICTVCKVGRLRMVNY
jgi:hypothetical protein